MNHTGNAREDKADCSKLKWVANQRQDFLEHLPRHGYLGHFDWPLTSLKEKLIKIGAKVVSHGRDATLQTAVEIEPQRTPIRFTPPGPPSAPRATAFKVLNLMLKFPIARSKSRCHPGNAGSNPF